MFLRDEYIKKVPKTKNIKYALLEVIVANGGEITPKEAYVYVMEHFSNLSALHKYNHTLSEKVYWENRVKSARRQLFLDGCLDNNAPVGVWRITHEGKRYLDNNQNWKADHEKNQSEFKTLASLSYSCKQNKSAAQKDGSIKKAFRDADTCKVGSQGSKSKETDAINRSNRTEKNRSDVGGYIRKKERIVYTDGSSYEGECINGEPNGQGVYMLEDGIKVEAEWKDWVPHNKGRYIYPNGSQLCGKFRNGKFHGNVIAIFPDGRKYNLKYNNGVIDKDHMNAQIKKQKKSDLNNNLKEFDLLFGCIAQGEPLTYLLVKALKFFGNNGHRG